MPIPHPSFLYRENSEEPKSPLPLEARKIHFLWSPLLGARPGTEHVGRWTVLNPDGVDIPVPAAYAGGHDMIRGYHRARTATEAEIDGYLQALVCKGGKLEGWSPRTKNFRGLGHSFDVVFTRLQTFGCTIDVNVPAGISEPVMGRSAPLPEPVMRREPQREPVMPQPVHPNMPELEPQTRENVAPETAPASNESSEDQSAAVDTTSEDDSDYVPPAAHTERETRSQRMMHHRVYIASETQAMMRQMRRFATAQNESENERAMRDSMNRRVFRGFSL